jgi:hypothetical protein
MRLIDRLRPVAPPILVDELAPVFQPEGSDHCGRCSSPYCAGFCVSRVDHDLGDVHDLIGNGCAKGFGEFDPSKSAVQRYSGVQRMVIRSHP